MLAIQIYDDWAGWLTVERTPNDIDYAANVARIHKDGYKVDAVRVRDGERTVLRIPAKADTRDPKRWPEPKLSRALAR